MMNSKSGRLGLLLSAVWLLGGGYWSIGRHSYYHTISTQNADRMCELDSGVLCQDARADVLPIEWSSIAIELVAGLAIIWVGIVAYKWVRSASH